ncbi:MAG: hypothetical protein JSV58_05290 [Candidatus Bathyarchaeota archaeon]|nr:MAG: hypothetical protein JSV58_05290 [Candidatus Bathyarchaeota archaeon]
MVMQNGKKDVAKQIRCISSLEERVFRLYKSFSEKLRYPHLKALALYIAYDSLKHSMILAGVSENIAESKVTNKDCERNLGETWQVVLDFHQEISKADDINKKELSSFANRLSDLESSLGEEYNTLAQLRTFQFMTKEISKVYGVDMTVLKDIFDLIIRDEENHKEILGLISDSSIEIEHSDDLVRFREPVPWYRYGKPPG